MSRDGTVKEPTGEPKHKPVKQLDRWRASHLNELELCLQAAISIRDNSATSARDKNEAIKTIARMIGALQPDKRAIPTTPVQSASERRSVDSKEREELDQLLDSLNHGNTKG